MPWQDPTPQKLLSRADKGPWRETVGAGLRAAGGLCWGSRWRCSPVKGEQLAVTAEGVAAEVDQLQLAETGQGGQGLQLVLLQV